DLLHLDVMDGHFVPNISFGPPVVKSIRKATSHFLDTHLMISDPLRYAKAFAEAGSQSLTFHIEAAPAAAPGIAEIRRPGLGVGLALNPDTPIERVFPYLDDVDMILVMSVFPGFSGQKFIPDVLEKIRVLRERRGFVKDVEIDGGISPETIGL